MQTEPLFSFELSRGLLRAISLFQADTDRPTIACTSLEIAKTGKKHEVILAATDGRRLASYQTEILQDSLFGEMPSAEQLVVDLTGCRKLRKVADRDNVTCEVFAKHVDFVAERMRYSARRLESGDGSINFPQWRSVVPSKKPESVTQISVNHELLADFGKAAKLITEKPAQLGLRTFGDGMPIAVYMLECREFFGLIMPLKFKNPESVPEWLQEPKKGTPAV